MLLNLINLIQIAMKREEAVIVIKRIFEECNGIEGKSLKLMPPDANNVLSKGCQIHIDTGKDDILNSCLKFVANKSNLAVELEENYLILYKPKKNKKPVT